MIRDLNDNPDLDNVSIVDGRLWLSESAQRDIELFAGRPNVDCDDPRAVLRALGAAARRLQARGQRSRRDDPRLERDFVGWGVLTSLSHAIVTKLDGPEAAGPWPPATLDGAPFDWVRAFFEPAPVLLQ